MPSKDRRKRENDRECINQSKKCFKMTDYFAGKTDKVSLKFY